MDFSEGLELILLANGDAQRALQILGRRAGVKKRTETVLRRIRRNRRALRYQRKGKKGKGGSIKKKTLSLKNGEQGKEGATADVGKER